MTKKDKFRREVLEKFPLACSSPETSLYRKNTPSTKKCVFSSK
jgi:hypothetical protein